MSAHTTHSIAPRTLGLGLIALSLTLAADGFATPPPITFTDVAQVPGVGLDDYERTPSVRDATLRQFLQDSLSSPQPASNIITTPMRSRGIPGVALLDFDGDGDLDIYVTNGPGTPNALYANQLHESGQMTFIDVAQMAGVQATAQDSNGACFGDIDNDGDEDLMVVGHEGGSALYENQGNGTFQDISASAGVDSGTYGMSCVMGDVDLDGRLDIFIARGYSLDTLNECFTDIYSPTIQPNDLFLNQGNNTFADVSASSGIRDLESGGMPAGINTITWSGALVDYDADGDLDLMTTDDQCNFPGPNFGGLSRGTVQLFRNDGSGNFTNHTLQAGLDLPSEWMGTAWADFNHDGHLDVFVTSFGEWGKQFVGAPIAVGDESSRWYLGDGNGGFTEPGLGSLVYTPFGWGTSAEDFDLDGDTDIVFYGGLDMVTHAEKSNPGTILLNGGNADFTYNSQVLGSSHLRRNDSGVASGDLNGDGFPDIVSVSNFDVPQYIPLVPYTVGGINYGSPFDPAFFAPLMDAVAPGEFVWNGAVLSNGTLALEINNGESSNNGLAVNLVGSVGLTPGAVNNRDGIGANVYFTPKHGETAIKPVLGGSSHVSQDSLTQHFGMGSKKKGTLEVHWPGGVKNKLYNVKDGMVTMPEIPCSYDTTDSYKVYKKCVKDSLQDLYDGGVVDRKFQKSLEKSAERAYRDAH